VITAPTTTRERILAAATTLFSRYGYKRTSMEDIASEANLSRAALYLQFRNKEDIFREGARQLHEQGLADARAALAGNGPLPECLRRSVEAKTLRMLEIASSSPHGDELSDEKNRLCGDLATQGEHEFLELITAALRHADSTGEIDLASAGVTAAEAAEVFTHSAAGLKGRDVVIDDYRKRLATFVQIFVTGLAP
jgi:AcrR family transcriptional regulator